MSNNEFDKIIKAQIDKCYSLLNVKHKEYSAINSDRLGYFKRAGTLEKIDPKAALFGMFVKHLVSIADMCYSNKQYTKEHWEEKITDSINYLLLLKALTEEENNGQNTN